MNKEPNYQAMVKSQKEKKEHTYEKVKKAVEEAIKEGKEVKMNDIAERAGINRSTFYKHKELKEIFDKHRKLREGQVVTGTVIKEKNGCPEEVRINGRNYKLQGKK